MHPTGPTLRRAYASAPTGQVHYYDSGGDGPPLLMLHQSPTSSTDFAATFPLFERGGVRVLAMDAPGLGMSSAPPWEPTIGDYATAAIAVLDHAGVSRADALGHHTGVQTALEAAALRPKRFGKLALYGAPLLSEAARRDYWEMIVPRERDEAVHPPAAGGEHLTRLFKQIERYFGPAVAHSMVTSRLMAGPSIWYAHNAALTHDMGPALQACRHPLLLISHTGEMLDQETRRAAQARPDAAFVDLGVTCSIALYQEPERLVACVLDFLKSDRSVGTGRA